MCSKWIVYTVLAGLLACSHQNDRQKAARHNVIMDIGGDEGGGKFVHEYHSDLAARLHLDRLEEGYDSLQIRVWLGHSMAGEYHVAIIRRTNNRWKGEVVTYSMSADPGTEKLDRVTKKTRTLSSEIQYEMKIGYLDLDSIVNLPHGEDSTACNKCGGTDGIQYVFEIATINKYRFFYYCEPQYNCDCTHAWRVVDFATRLERELDFHYVH
jgi:hypothetical protein